MEQSKQLHPAFNKNKYTFRKKVFKLFGGAFHVYDEQGNVVFYSKQKPFKLKEDFRVYADEGKTQELLTIKTPQILDVSATYHVEDATTGEKVGSVKRQGLKSIVQDEWSLLSVDGQEIGKLAESSLAGALLSRFIKMVPQTYSITTTDGTKVAEVRQQFNPFVLKHDMTMTNPEGRADRRLLIAAGILLVGIEGRQG